MVDISLHWRNCFPSRCQLQLACWWGRGRGALFPVSLLWACLTWVCAGPMNAVTVAVGSYFHQSCCIWRHFSLVPTTTSGWLLESFHSDPWALRVGVWWGRLFKSWVFQVLLLSAHYPVVDHCVKNFALQEKTSDEVEGCTDTVISLWELLYWIVHLAVNKVSRFSLGLITYLVLGSWLH